MQKHEKSLEEKIEVRSSSLSAQATPSATPHSVASQRLVRKRPTKKPEGMLNALFA